MDYHGRFSLSYSNDLIFLFSVFRFLGLIYDKTEGVFFFLRGVCCIHLSSVFFFFFSFLYFITIWRIVKKEVP